MASIRENIYNSAMVRDDYLNACLNMNQTSAGISAAQVSQFLQDNNIPLGMRGINQDLSIYDIFVLWHVVAMSVNLSEGNAAHGGPIFLPWHRLYMIRLEEMMQQMLSKPDFGLPYWDWAEDGELPASLQWRADLWNSNYLGEARGAVRSGILGDMRVRLVMSSSSAELISINPRPIERAAGQGIFSLPIKQDEQRVLNQSIYDAPPWNTRAQGHRNDLEGWINGPPQMHNRVHVWIGGDMSPGSSPNDPVFFLNHCNVDRIWENWMGRNGRIYAPRANQGPSGHRINDLMVSLIGGTLTPADVLDPSPWYNFDTALVA